MKEIPEEIEEKDEYIRELQAKTQELEKALEQARYNAMTNQGN